MKRHFGPLHASLTCFALVGCIVPVPLPPSTIPEEVLFSEDCSTLTAERNRVAEDMAALVDADPVGSEGGLVVLPPAVFVVTPETNPEFAGLRRDLDTLDALRTDLMCG
ncbi:MAG: hypothetical protein HRU32_16095 [Rhodobacteraceae bacterium]|nr:hypothetical protein [Paracoccaceae bacterium]